MKIATTNMTAKEQKNRWQKGYQTEQETDCFRNMDLIFLQLNSQKHVGVLGKRKPGIQPKRNSSETTTVHLKGGRGGRLGVC